MCCFPVSWEHERAPATASAQITMRGGRWDLSGKPGERGCRTGGSRTDGSAPTKANRSRAGVVECWCYLIISLTTEEEASGPVMEIL